MAAPDTLFDQVQAELVHVGDLRKALEDRLAAFQAEERVTRPHLEAATALALTKAEAIAEKRRALQAVSPPLAGEPLLEEIRELTSEQRAALAEVQERQVLVRRLGAVAPGLSSGAESLRSAALRLGDRLSEHKVWSQTIDAWAARVAEDPLASLPGEVATLLTRVAALETALAGSGIPAKLLTAARERFDTEAHRLTKARKLESDAAMVLASTIGADHPDWGTLETRRRTFADSRRRLGEVVASSATFVARAAVFLAADVPTVSAESLAALTDIDGAGGPAAADQEIALSQAERTLVDKALDLELARARMLVDPAVDAAAEKLAFCNARTARDTAFGTYDGASRDLVDEWEACLADEFWTWLDRFWATKEGLQALSALGPAAALAAARAAEDALASAELDAARERRGWEAFRARIAEFAARADSLMAGGEARRSGATRGDGPFPHAGGPAGETC